GKSRGQSEVDPAEEESELQGVVEDPIPYDIFNGPFWPGQEEGKGQGGQPQTKGDKKEGGKFFQGHEDGDTVGSPDEHGHQGQYKVLGGQLDHKVKIRSDPKADAIFGAFSGWGFLCKNTMRNLKVILNFQDEWECCPSRTDALFLPCPCSVQSRTENRNQGSI